ANHELTNEESRDFCRGFSFCSGIAGAALLLTFDGRQALAIQVQQMLRIVLRLVGGAGLESRTHTRRLAITGGARDELHQVECNVLVPPSANRKAAEIAH